MIPAKVLLSNQTPIMKIQFWEWRMVWLNSLSL